MNKSTRIMGGALLLCFALAGAKTAGAQSVTINGKTLQSSVSPISRQGRTLVPMRAIFEGLGASVNWDGGSKTITSKVGGKTVTMKLGSRTANVNGQNVTLEQAPSIYKGNTMVPLRFVSEALGAKVNYNANSRSIAIATGSDGGSMGGGTTQRAGTDGTTGQWLSDAPTSLRVSDDIGQTNQYGTDFITVKATVRNSQNTQLGRTISVKDAVLVLNDGKQVKYQMTLKDWARDMRYRAGDENQLTLHFPASKATRDANRVVITLFSSDGTGAGRKTSVFRATFPNAQASAGDAMRRDGTRGSKGELLVTPEVALRIDGVEKVNRYGSDFVLVTGILRNSSPQQRSYTIPTTNAATLTLRNGETVKSAMQAREIGDSSRAALQRGEEAALKLWFPIRDLNDKNAALDAASVRLTLNHSVSGAAPQTKTFDVTF